VKQLAWLVRCAHDTAGRRLAEAGLAPVRSDGRTVYFDPRDALPVLLGVGDGLNPQAEKARLDRARAEIAEHQLAERRGEYVRGDDVDVFLLALVGGFAQRARAIPPKAAPEVRSTASDREGEAVLEGFVNEALDELAGAARAAGERCEQRRAKSVGAA